MMDGIVDPTTDNPCNNLSRVPCLFGDAHFRYRYWKIIAKDI